jgi:hypothetical protein
MSVLKRGGFNMKKNFITLSLCVLIIVGIVFSYSRTYKISDNKKQLEYNIKQFINRPTVIHNNIDIKQELNINNKKYILLLIDNILGEAELTKGINNKYKIESVRSGGYFRSKVYKTNKGKYFIVEGKNYDMKIAYIKILLDNKEYKISIPQQEYFLAYCEVPIETQIEYLNFDELKL